LAAKLRILLKSENRFWRISGSRNAHFLCWGELKSGFPPEVPPGFEFSRCEPLTKKVKRSSIACVTSVRSKVSNKTEHLHILAVAVLLEPCFEQAPQLGEALRQLPSGPRAA